MDEFTTRWANRTAGPFPEAAETLGIDTDLVMAAVEIDGKMRVLYSPTREEAASRLLATVLRRDFGGVLQVVGEPVDASDVLERVREALS